MSVKPKQLFVSYAHQDKKRIKHVVELLKAGGCEPWFDHHLVGGRHWKSQLLDEIRRCDVFVYILTPHSVASKWCQWEFAEAVRLGKPVVPVLLRSCQLNPSLERIQFVDFTVKGESHDVAVAKLMRSMIEAVPILYPDEAPAAQEPTGEPEYVRGSEEDFPESEDILLEDALPKERPHPRRYSFVGCLSLMLVLLLGAVMLRSWLDNRVPSGPQVLSPVPTSIIQLPTDTEVPISTVETLVSLTITPSLITPPTSAPSDTPLPTVPSPTPPPSYTPTPPPAATAPEGLTSTPVPVQAVVQVASINLRSGPGTTYNPIGFAYSGNALIVVGRAPNGWLLVETDQGIRAWVSANVVTLNNSVISIPTVETIPPTRRSTATSTPQQLCHPEEFVPVCGSNDCPSEYTSQCNPEGTGYVCVWDPAKCASGGGSIFRPPVIPTAKPGDPTPTPFVCTSAWLQGELQRVANELGISVSELIHRLIADGYDRDNDGDIDCDDYNALNPS